MTPSRAYRLVRSALSRGDLTRPTSCGRCGRTPPPSRDGRSLIHAHHHHGYECPLDVEWLCAWCHRKETPKPSRPGGRSHGAHNGQAKLTAEQVAVIHSSAESGAALARRFGVDRSAVNRIRRGE